MRSIRRTGIRMSGEMAATTDYTSRQSRRLPTTGLITSKESPPRYPVARSLAPEMRQRLLDWLPEEVPVLQEVADDAVVLQVETFHLWPNDLWI